MPNLSHKNLEVYKLSLLMVKEIYQQTKQYPPEERFTLVSQLRRAAISVSSNIAEGCSRISKKEKRRFYEISRSSMVEIDTQLEISLLLEYISMNQIVSLEKLNESIFRMLSKMIGNLEMNAPLAQPH